MPVHLRPITGNDPAERLPQESAKRRRLAGGAYREHREQPGHERPQPRLAVGFLGPRFVDVQLLLREQLLRQRLIRRPQSRRDLVLDLHRQRRRARLPQERAEELGRPPLALAIKGHQQGHESHQPRPRLPLRHAGGQFRTSRFATGGTRQPVPLVLSHVRLDLGHFPDLVPQRLRVVTRELRPTAPALSRPQRQHVVTLVGGNQGSLVLLVAGLPATFLLRLASGRLRPGVGMLRTGRQRGVLRRLAFDLPLQLLDPSFQLGNLSLLRFNPRQQQADDGLGFRRLPRDHFFRDYRFHAHCCATQPAFESRSICQEKPPGCERLRKSCKRALDRSNLSRPLWKPLSAGSVRGVPPGDTNHRFAKDGSEAGASEPVAIQEQFQPTGALP